MSDHGRQGLHRRHGSRLPADVADLVRYGDMTWQTDNPRNAALCSPDIDATIRAKVLPRAKVGQSHAAQRCTKEAASCQRVTASPSNRRQRTNSIGRELRPAYGGEGPAR